MMVNRNDLLSCVIVVIHMAYYQWLIILFVVVSLSVLFMVIPYYFLWILVSIFITLQLFILILFPFM